MWHFIEQAAVLSTSIKAARAKIFLFLYAVIILVCIFGSIMYLVEGGVNERFDSIPRSIYWAIVTLTTVGYGDIAPVTFVGQFLSAIVMIIGYAVIAVPTGIVSAEFVKNSTKSSEGSNVACRYCSKEGHENDATFCKYCGEELHPELD
jgi:voltage-gated potassium channel